MQVERYFLGTSSLQFQVDASSWWAANTGYWTSLQFGGLNWWWPDGTTAGTGAVSNEPPSYAHFTYHYQVQMVYRGPWDYAGCATDHAPQCLSPWR